MEAVELANRGTASASAKVGTDSKEASPVAEDAEGASAMQATCLRLFSAFGPNEEQSVAKLVFKTLLVLIAYDEGIKFETAKADLEYLVRHKGKC